MCRNIRTLFNFDPPATDEEVRAASVQFVRKLSGFTKPSQVNQAAFDEAVEDVAAVARRLIDSLVTSAAPRDREEGCTACAHTQGEGRRMKDEGRTCWVHAVRPYARCSIVRRCVPQRRSLSRYR